MVLYDFCLSTAQVCYIIVYMRKVGQSQGSISNLKSKLNLCSDRGSVGQSVLVSSTHLGPKTSFLLPSDSYGFVDVGLPL
jgi:hypothetical protein